jgi:hypothetical protein
MFSDGIAAGSHQLVAGFRTAKFVWKPPRSWIFSRCPWIG